jgi:hypothetical protein
VLLTLVNQIREQDFVEPLYPDRVQDLRELFQALQLLDLLHLREI